MGRLVKLDNKLNQIEIWFERILARFGAKYFNRIKN